MGIGDIGGSGYGMSTRMGVSPEEGERTRLLNNQLLQNSVEMVTTPEDYPIWKTRKPVVVIDEGGGKGNDAKIMMAKTLEDGDGNDGDDTLLNCGAGPLMHRYRYLAVTPGATIDWSLCIKKDHIDDGSASTGRGNRTEATTPPGSDDEEDNHNDDDRSVDDQGALQYEGSSSHGEAEDDDDEEEEFPPILFEEPHHEGSDDDDGDAKDGRGHIRVPSVYDADGNPMMSSPLGHNNNATEESSESMAAENSTASFASLNISGNKYKKKAAMTWENVSALPYRTRCVGAARDVEDVEIVDQWNDPSDPAFAAYWETKKSEIDKSENDNEESMKGTTVTHGDDDADDANIPSLNEDDDPMEAEKEPRFFIVCYHLPVILSRDPDTSEWNACWSESLISKSELHGVSAMRKTTWIGTVSNIPVPLLQDPSERRAIQRVLEGMDCIPIFFTDEHSESLLDLMYLGFCKQVLWPSFHNVDLLDLATNGWGQRQWNSTRSDPVMACALAAAEAKERKRANSTGSAGESTPSTRASAAGGAATTTEGDKGGKVKQLKSDWDQRRLDSWWNAYMQVNQKFSEVVASLVSGGDVVWVHDYHLALLPRMLREGRNESNIIGSSKDGGRHSFIPSNGPIDQKRLDEFVGPKNPTSVRMIFFIHVPFPTSQVFRELEHGEALLEGVLHADVVGFHAFDHARHFLNAAKRILGLTYESLVGGLIGVRHRGTKVLVTVSNVSVEGDIIDALLQFPMVKDEAAALQEKHGDRMIISGIAVAQRLSGVTYKLLAFERLLADYPVWQSKVVLLQRCLIPGARRVDEADTLREVRSLVVRIRNEFGPEVIDYEEQVGSVLPIDQRLAIWTSSRVMMHTPIREGLNLCPLEYVFARKEPADPGVVIASEFSAVSSILNGALRVNPYDIQMCVTSIDSALSMSQSERDARRGRDIDFVSTCPSGLWTRNVLRDLNDATLSKSTSSRMDVVGDSSPDSILAREAELGLERLDLLALQHAYKTSKMKRVIIIDFNGTLVVKEPAGKYLKREILGTSGFKPSHVTTLALARLCSDPLNTVYVVSGDSQQNLERAVGNVPGLGLAASNGTCFADPCRGQERLWQYLDFGVDWNAVKKVAMPIISKFTARTNGSFVKLSHSSIGWSYYSCDPEWGSLQASHLVTELGEALHSYDVRFVALKGIVEGTVNFSITFSVHSPRITFVSKLRCMHSPLSTSLQKLSRGRGTRATL